jgi:hypothetical protein
VADQIGNWGAFISAINILRQDEGSSVTILGDNPDFNGQPNCAIICNGDWTDWEDRRFAADTLLQCFDAALEAYAPCCNTDAEDGITATAVLDQEAVLLRIERAKENARAYSLLDTKDAFKMLLRRLDALADDIRQGLHDEDGAL